MANASSTLCVFFFYFCIGSSKTEHGWIPYHFHLVHIWHSGCSSFSLSVSLPLWFHLTPISPRLALSLPSPTDYLSLFISLSPSIIFFLIVSLVPLILLSPFLTFAPSLLTHLTSFFLFYLIKSPSLSPGSLSPRPGTSAPPALPLLSRPNTHSPASPEPLPSTPLISPTWTCC